MPRFVAQRALYEVREKPSNCYSWVAFMFSNILVETVYQLFAAVLVYASWYFAVFGANQSSLTQGLMLVFCLQFYLFMATFAFMVIAALPDAVTAANVTTLLFSMMLIFNGVLQIPSALPAFWLFMWRVSPLSYLVGAWAGTGLSGRPVHCARNELAVFSPPPGSSCGEYLAEYFQRGALGQLYNPLDNFTCQYCPLRNADQFLARSEIYRSQTYRNIGIVFAYVGFNLSAAVVLYYAFRVRQAPSFRRLFHRS
jgi:ABC-type multidrug transport system permease subunit